eukprot:245200_1
MISNTFVIAALLTISFNVIVCMENKIKLQIPAISTIPDSGNVQLQNTLHDGVDTSTTGAAILIGHQIALHDLNSDNNILTRYEIESITLPSDKSTAEALKHAIFASIQSFCNGISSIITSPIFLGCPWSSLSVLTSMVLDIFNLLTISSSATAPTLSARDGSFLRTCGSDTDQAKALVQLCDYFEWSKIGVIYINDAYGEGLNNAISDEITQNDEINIDIKSKAYDENSIDSAAKFIEDNELYITILIVRDVHIESFFEQLKKHDLVGWPHYYIGVDSWFVEAEIRANNILQYVPGYIGTIPGSLSMLTREQYNQSGIYDGNMTIYNLTVQKNAAIAEIMWQKSHNNHHGMINFGYDSMYALGMALNIYDKRHSLDSMFNECYAILDLEEIQTELQPIQTEIRDILINEVQFIGATGHVSFKENGNRRGSMFLYGYVTNEGTIKYFGGKVDDHSVPFIDDIVIWPSDFKDVPLSSPTVNMTNYIEIERTECYVILSVVIVCFLCSWYMIVLLWIKKRMKHIPSEPVELAIGPGGPNIDNDDTDDSDEEESKISVIVNKNNENDRNDIRYVSITRRKTEAIIYHQRGISGTSNMEESKTNDSLSLRLNEYISKLPNESERRIATTFIKYFKPYLNDTIPPSSSSPWNCNSGRTSTVRYSNSHLNSRKQNQEIKD